MLPHSNLDTEHLLGLAAKGDRVAVDALFEQHRPRLKRMIKFRMDPRMSVRVDPSDVVQEALTEAYGQISAFLEDRPVAFYPWLRQIAWNRLIDLHRRHVVSQKRSVRREFDVQDQLSNASAQILAQQLAVSESGPFQKLVRQELRERVQHAISCLSESLREALLLRYLEQLSAEDRRRWREYRKLRTSSDSSVHYATCENY